jgi:predicted nucleotidyltransferase component of viral defense system
VQVKVEVNPVLRGTVYPPERRQPSPEVQAHFGFAEVPVLAVPDLYAGKLVAALDRQHPRDLYDVRLFRQQARLTREVHLAFLVYLISHDRPLHEVLRPRFRDIQDEFERAFRGMTVDEVPLAALEQARVDLLAQLHAGLTPDDRAFLLSVAQGQPR